MIKNPVAIGCIAFICCCSLAWLPKKMCSEKNLPEKILAKHKKKIIFIAGGCTHGPMVHEFRAGSLLLQQALEQSMPGVFESILFEDVWPPDSTVFNNAAAIVMYLNGGGGHLVIPHADFMDALAKKGVGIACLHFAVEVPKGRVADHFLDWIGGYFETGWSVNPYWKASFDSIPPHPVTRGVKPFSASDEWYYHMRFRTGMKNITPLLITIPPAATLNRPDGPHENNAFVRADRTTPQYLSWVTENPGGGRGFGFTGGHSHRNWANDDFRKLVLNGIAWIAHVDIPGDGLASSPVPQEALQNNLDKKPCVVQ